MMCAKLECNEINGLRFVRRMARCVLHIGCRDGYPTNEWRLKMKTNQTVAYVISDDYSTIAFSVVGNGQMVLDLNKCHPDIVRRAAAVGMAQVRIVDAAAIGTVDKDGNAIPPAERNRMKAENMRKLIDHYHTGTDQWSLTRSATPRGDSEEILWAALVRALGEHAEAALAKTMQTHPTRHEALKYLSGAKRVASALLAIKAERIKPVADADADLAEFMASVEAE